MELEPTINKQTPFTPPFKRLNQKELTECLEHGWKGRITLIKPVTVPDNMGKYQRMWYDTQPKTAYNSVTVFPAVGSTYRQVDFGVIAALEKKGLIAITYISDCEAVFELRKEASA